MRYVKILGLAAMLLIVGAAPSRATNLVTDPGFESCSGIVNPNINPPPGWNASGPVFCANVPHSGSWSTAFFSASTAFLSQTIGTLPGHTYDFSFWLFSGGPNPYTFDASFGGNLVLHQTTSLQNYTLEDFQVSATSASTIISFTAPQAADPNEAWFFDDVSVTDLTLPAPEPATLALLGAGLAALGFARRRKS